MMETGIEQELSRIQYNCAVGIIFDLMRQNMIW